MFQETDSKRNSINATFRESNQTAGQYSFTFIVELKNTVIKAQLKADKKVNR